MKTHINTLLRFAFVLLFFAGGDSSGRAAESSEQTEGIPMRLMSFNIRFDNPNDGPDAWPHRKDFVAGVFRFHQIDVGGTQEGLFHQLEELDELLPEFAWVGVGRDDGKRGGEFCAIYYRTDRFELIDDGTVWLSETPDEPGSRGWDAALPRIFTWARLHDRENDRRFVVLNAHFDHQGREARLESAGLMRRKATELAGGDPVVVMGDLNATESHEPYRAFVDPDAAPDQVRLYDGFHHSLYGHHGPTSTWNGFREIVPNRRIDFIFADSGFRFVQHGILADIREGRFPSDHLPVVADVKFRTHPD